MEYNIDSIVNKAINYGVSSWGRKEAMAIQIAVFWVDGWIAGKEENISEKDKQNIRNRVNTYKF